jgi:ribose/xylose/arabinose/galactoside ABC-type transport system permease subunit
VNALITTLGISMMFGGVAILIGGPSIVNLPEASTGWARRRIRVLGLQLPVWFLIALAAARTIC